MWKNRRISITISNTRAIEFLVPINRRIYFTYNYPFNVKILVLFELLKTTLTEIIKAYANYGDKESQIPSLVFSTLKSDLR